MVDLTNKNEHVFLDYDSLGKKKPWNLKKRMNLLYSHYLEILEYNKAANVKDCGNIIGLKEDSEGHLRVNQTWFCHSRLCPMCNWRRAIKQSYHLKCVLQKALESYPKGCFLFLTLTEKNCYADELHSLLKAMTKGFMRLSQYKKIKKNLLGYVRTTEITINENKKEYHPHMHIILFMKSTYFSGKQNYISKTQWTTFYKKARKLNYDPIIDIRVIKGQNDNLLLKTAQEVAKYQVKDSDFLTGNINKDLEIVKTLENALKGTKSISYGGIFKEINRNIKLESTLNSKENDKIAIWNEKQEKYYLSRY